MYRNVILLLATLALVACVSQPVQQPSAPQPETPEQKINAALARGDFNQVASFYAEQSASADPQTAAAFQLKANLLRLDLSTEQAQPAPSPSPDAPLESEPRLKLAAAMASLGKNDAAQTITLLTNLDASGFDQYERGLYLRTLGDAQQRTGDPTAVANLLNAELFPLPPNRRDELTRKIWNALVVHPQPTEIPSLDQRNPNLSGWLALCNETRRLEATPEALTQVLEGWRGQFPTHPGNGGLIAEIIAQAMELSAPIERVALLLPFDGDLAGFATAIRDGFIAMRFAEDNSSLTVRTYSASGDSARTAYDQAVNEGAQFIVGPLDKPGVEALRAYPSRKLPMLALNSLTPPAPGATPSPAPTARMTQFGLLPEDEALDLANRAWQKGHRRMAVIAPNNDLGTRLSGSFKSQWTELGGAVVEDARYTSNVEAFKSAVQTTFSLAQSEARAATLRRVLQRPVVFVARARADLDGIMLIASSTDARQIMPQFRYFGIDYLPIYSTSMVFSGGGSDDLDGIMFGTMPWLLNIGDQSVRDTIRRRWVRRRADYDRFYAFGVDAYRLMKMLPDMSRQPGMLVSGATGKLSLDASGRIRRTLSWAKYQGGVPRLLSE